MTYRVYVEKKEEFANEARALYNDATSLLGIKGLKGVRLFNRYDADHISKELFDYATKSVFSEPQLDVVSEDLDVSGTIFATEYLPGQFDQRADSAAQCIQFISKGERPLIKTAKVYVLDGDLSDDDLRKIKNYVINPVEAREASLELPASLVMEYEVPSDVKIIDGFIDFSEEDLHKFIKENGLAMDFDDLSLCQAYFRQEKRNPTITEIKMIDTYWSDHCRHTTFLTSIDDVKFEDEEIEKTFQEYIKLREDLNDKKPVCLMDLATIAVKHLKKTGKLDKLDESEEINACTVKIKVNGEDWLLLFKNETHNHPTEIEPFGGAATCIGGAIRDPLSGRSYVYGAMRLTGAGDPTVSISETIKGKLPQRKIVQTAAAGYSSYGNQIGLATGIVDELYHPGYIAKRMEIGAVIAATPKENVKRERPSAGDVVILLGGSTGRDGCGGATGSSKSHTIESLETCGAEVQKGNAPEERKLQRLFRNSEAAKMIKRCNDFGAGGVSVAIGELAAGLEIDLNKVPKKYEGLDGTELAISESQERMAVVVAKEDVERFLTIAKSENLQAVPVAVVSENPRLVMYWNGKKIVDVARSFLDSNGAEKHAKAIISKSENFDKVIPQDFKEGYKELVSDLNVCSKRGLSERFDSTIGAGSVLMPFGGKKQLTPVQAMVQKISMEKGDTEDCSLMSWGYNPYISEKSQYHGAYLAVVESVSKLIATGSDFNEVYLTFQEYFEKLGNKERSWGKPLSALLGAFKAQMDLGIGSVGGKDSMSGSFENINVPPTLVSFAVSVDKCQNIISNDFKEKGSKVYLLTPEYENNLPKATSLLALFERVNKLMRDGKILACSTVTYGGIAEAIFKMCLGNGFGFKYNDVSLDLLFKYLYGSFVVESKEELDGILLGEINDEEVISYKDEVIEMKELSALYENRLEDVFNCNITSGEKEVPNISYKAETWPKARVKVDTPKVLIPVFPGTNCEFDSAKAFEKVGAKTKILVIKNLNASDIENSVKEFIEEMKDTNIIFIPGGFSGGDEPDGSAKFITAFFRNEDVKNCVHNFLDNHDGLMLGICNGFQALIKLGLVPYGRIMDTDENSPTLTYNVIARHQSKIVRTRVCSNKSPWLALCEVGDVYNVPISHGEGRFIGNLELLNKLAENGQIATQYVDLDGNASMDVKYNPNGSTLAIEGITSFDGRILGKMGHSERVGKNLYKNVIGDYDIKMFKAAVNYFKEEA